MLFIAGGVQAATLTSLAGDQDSFGSGKPIGSTVSVNEFSSTPSDGDFDRFGLNIFNWSHVFDVTGQTVTGATLTIVTLDMEDNGAGDGDGGGPFDDLLFIDGTEFAGAFDDVFTIDGDGNTQFTPNVSVFDLAAFLPSLADGTINVTVDPAGGTRKDSIAIDYAELVVHTTPIPLPASSLLLLAGLGGLAAMRRRKLG